MSIKTHVSGQKKKEAESQKSRTELANDRYRKRLHITLDPQVYEWLKKSTDNASRLIESLLFAVTQQIKPVAFIMACPEPDLNRRLCGLQPHALPG
jgi:TFIIF-interacting CTD phosphatase-like protein